MTVDNVTHLFGAQMVRQQIIPSSYDFESTGSLTFMTVRIEKSILFWIEFTDINLERS